MPHRRVPRLPSLVGPLSVALALVAALALAPGATSSTYAQVGPEYGPMFGPRGGPGPGLGSGGEAFGYQTVFGEFVVAGQTQICREAPGAEANFRAFYGPTQGEFNPSFIGYVFPPYGGMWGFYTGAGNICLWRPH